MTCVEVRHSKFQSVTILVVTMFAIRNKCIATSHKCLTSSNNVCY